MKYNQQISEDAVSCRISKCSERYEGDSVFLQFYKLTRITQQENLNQILKISCFAFLDSLRAF